MMTCLCNGLRLVSSLALRNEGRLSSYSQTAARLSTTPIRSTFVMKRVFEPCLAKLGEEVHLKRLNFVYKPTDTLHKKIPPMTVILTDYVEGVGDVGDTVTVKAYIARNELLLPGLAVYDTPENRDKYANLKLDRPRRTPFCLKTLRELESRTLYIPMNGAREFTLNQSHVRIAFRLAGVELTDDCIELPEEAVTADCTEKFVVKVLINRLFTANVPAQIYSYKLDATGKPVPPPSDNVNR